MKWKLISIGNTICLFVIFYIVLIQHRDLEQKIALLEDENSKLITITDDMRSDINDLLDRIDYLNNKVDRLELDKAIDNISESSNYPTMQNRDAHFNVDAPGEVSDVGFSADMGDCSGMGKGLIGLFVDVFTKCPSDVRGFGIQVTR